MTRTQTTKGRITAANMCLAQSRVNWLNEHSTSHQFRNIAGWCIDSFVFRTRSYGTTRTQSPKRLTAILLDTVHRQITDDRK
jgi:hypothetical protein